MSKASLDVTKFDKREFKLAHEFLDDLLAFAKENEDNKLRSFDTVEPENLVRYFSPTYKVIWIIKAEDLKNTIRTIPPFFVRVFDSPKNRRKFAALLSGEAYFNEEEASDITWTEVKLD